MTDYSLATELDPNWYQAWHTWALANFEVITQLEVVPNALTAQHFDRYIIPAVEGFLRSIALSPGNSLQDTLRLLTLWFTYGYQGGVASAITNGLPSVNVDVWLEVIPQIIARIHTPRQTISNLIIRLLNDVGKIHPQALVYPLTVASKSNVASRKTAAENIMAKMRTHSDIMVDQAELISTELIRAAILWHEIWYDGLEEASKHYYADGNIPGMFEVLEPLHEMVERVSRPVVGGKRWLMIRDQRLYGRLRLFNPLDMICPSQGSILGGIKCTGIQRRFNRHGIFTTR